MDVKASEFMKELGAIKRDRDLVKASLLTDAAKAKLLSQLDARVKEISSELERLDVSKRA